MDRFFAQRPRVDGYDYRVARYIDAVSLHLYPPASEPPEAAMQVLRSSRAVLKKNGVQKPIWNTEVNYGLIGGQTVSPLSAARQASYVARTYLLNAANGIKRVHWYAWDQRSPIFNTYMTQPDGDTPSAGGVAFRVVRSWMVNSRFDSCTRSSVGTYSCVITYSSGKRRVYWNPTRTVYVTTAGSATYWQGLGGATHALSGGQRLKIGHSPKMVRSSR